MFNVSTSGGPDCVLTFAGMSPLGVAGTSVCDKKLDVVVETSGLLSSCAVGEQSKYTLSKRHDLFLTLTKSFWCLNPNQSNIKLNLKVKFQHTCVFSEMRIGNINLHHPYLLWRVGCSVLEYLENA